MWPCTDPNLYICIVLCSYLLITKQLRSALNPSYFVPVLAPNAFSIVAAELLLLCSHSRDLLLPCPLDILRRSKTPFYPPLENYSFHIRSLSKMWLFRPNWDMGTTKWHLLLTKLPNQTYICKPCATLLSGGLALVHLNKPSPPLAYWSPPGQSLLSIPFNNFLLE